jgi:hypothetical protein
VKENQHSGGGNLPMNILERREIHFEKLQRVGTNLFCFMLTHEALYVVNLTPATALKRYNACIFVEIQKMVAGNKTLKEQDSERNIPCLFPILVYSVRDKNHVEDL